MSRIFDLSRSIVSEYSYLVPARQYNPLRRPTRSKVSPFSLKTIVNPIATSFWVRCQAIAALASTFFIWLKAMVTYSVWRTASKRSNSRGIEQHPEVGANLQTTVGLSSLKPNSSSAFDRRNVLSRCRWSDPADLSAHAHKRFFLFPWYPVPEVMPFRIAPVAGDRPVAVSGCRRY